MGEGERGGADHRQGQYARLLAALAREDAVVGAWLGGSRGKGYGDARSDYDLWAIVRDGQGVGPVAALVAGLGLDAAFDVRVVTLADLRALRRWGHPEGWLRYAFADTRAVLDKTGEVQPALDAIGRFPRRRQRPFTRAWLDAYLNAAYRSVKAHARGRRFAARLDAARSVDYLLIALFALHGRFKPYNDYLDREIHLLTALGAAREGLLARLAGVMAEGEPRAQLRLRDEMDAVFRPRGYGDVFDGWREHWAGLARDFGVTRVMSDE
ncbi:MAG TPA: hypothetical protein VFW96_29900 [Thermomicrobiales bacterium]|nr:hypothetical protein [Thermomicrobiales bacterium]